MSEEIKIDVEYKQSKYHMYIMFSNQRLLFQIFDTEDDVNKMIGSINGSQGLINFMSFYCNKIA